MGDENGGFLYSKRKTFRRKGVDISGVTKFLKGNKYLRPIGDALSKEYGKRISLKEYIRKGSDKGKFEYTGFGMMMAVRRLNKRVWFRK
jgi:hypothetical protein